MGEIEVGDYILGADGERQKVLAKYPHKNWKFNKISFSDGTSTEAGDEHLWTSWRARHTCKKTRRYSKEGKTWNKYSLYPVQAEVITTEGLKDWMERGYNPLIPVSSPVRYQSGYKPSVDPYLLGALLGDGSLGKGAVHLHKHQDEDMFYPLLDSLGIKYSISKDKTCVRFANENLLHKQLEDLGLIDTKSNNKFIPRKYLYMNTENRVSLLQGLLDTDGYVCERGQVYYTSVSERLTKDFQQLVHSLGGVTTITSKVGSYKKPCGEKVECQVAYTQYVKLHESVIPFRMQRKADRYLVPKRRLHRTVTNIEYSRHCDGACITVSNPNRLYLTDSFIVTHNSFASLAHHLKNIHYPDYKGVVVRRTTPMLQKAGAIWDEAKSLYKKVDNECKIRSHPNMEITFRNGAMVAFNHFARPDNKDDWQGSQLTSVVMDELTHFEEEQMWYLFSRLRTKLPIKVNLRATMNPDPDGWVNFNAHIKLH